ncbi:KICSTOR complex protein SZT2-like isoform X5 [Scylla paramamosain]|uniref:KICSTOR complex protein SZT2-like isoform X5 n=1 Tax=Scylla paramamosain TaxID=85552 RepID=UPI0030831EFF
MTPTDHPPPDEEGVEVLEAEHVYILMKREYRISRNVRAEWYLRRINSIITFPRREKLSDNEEELEVVSVLPMDVPPEWDSDTSHLYHYRITQRSTLHFLARKYRLVFCLDLSPSTSIVDETKSSAVLDEVFTMLRQCLRGIVRPFYIPGSLLLFQPEIYLTIIAHTPFFKSQSQQVLVQGWLLMERNLDQFLHNIQVKLTMLEAQLAQATAQTYGQLGEDPFLQAPSSVLPNPMVSPDIGFVDMLRYGIVALQLLPENSSAGIVVITDGVIGLPDATVFDSLLVQLRNQTIACSFLQLGSVYQPQRSFGYIPFTDLMNFLATATCGAYMPTLPPVGNDYEYDMNDYHKSLLAWGFQKVTRELCSPDGDDAENEDVSLLLPLTREVTELMRKKERETQLHTSLNAVLSCRLREGYAIKEVAIVADQIQLVLVLPWKYSIFIEYHIRSAWPPTQSSVYTEVWIEATYEFLNDVTSDANRQFRSKYRQSMVTKYWHTLQHLRGTDMLLVGLQSFSASPTYYTLPDCIKNGHPVFYRNPGQPHSILDANSEQFPQFTNFWRKVCSLETNIWQKWMHIHRIGVILEHDHPLPKNLHITSTSGRYGIVHCRQAELALTTLLVEWCDFVLIENDSYIKFLYRDGELDKPPVSFFVVRITSKPPPCLVIRLAFLGGTPGHIRNQMMTIIKNKIQGLTFPLRVTLTERSKSLPPTMHAPEDKMSEELTISASGDLQPTAVRPSLSRMSSNIPCCVITYKPVEKILIWYDKTPSNLLSPVVVETPPGVAAVARSIGAKPGPTKSATHNMSLLSRYLHHRRWIWAVQPPSAPAVSLSAVARILNTLTRMRLQEGFNFAHSCNGIITMVREFVMKLDLCEDEEEGLLEGGQATFPCIAQYVLFPPHITNSSRDSVVEEDWEEGESVEADGVMEIVTECWVEPQNGVVAFPSPRAQHLNNCSYRQLAHAFFPVDQKCIWSMMTVEHLLQMCQGAAGGNGGCVPDGPDHHADLPILDDAAMDQRVQQVPFCLDLMHLLPMCQQAELLVSTYIQDLLSSLVKRVTFHCDTAVDEANRTLYDLLLVHVKQLHRCEYNLSTAELLALPGVLQERSRPPGVPPSLFSNTNIKGKTEDPPKWKCFLKGVSSNHLLFTLLPASYHDLKLLLVKGANVSDPDNLALKLVPGGTSIPDLDTETNTTDQPAGGPLSEQHISFESSTSSLTHMTSPSLPPTTPTNTQPAPSDDHTPARMRYKSGPAPHTSSHVVQPVYVDSHGRERASSFHVSQERCNFFGQSASASERNRTGSVDSPTKEPQTVLPKTTSPNEHIRKRYISMPSKSFAGTFTPSSKSTSTEGLRSEECCVPLHIQSVGEPGEAPTEHRISSLEDSSSAGPPLPSHQPLLGTVTLPIYVYDCKLTSIITQLINSEDRTGVVGRDLYLDSTSRLESVLHEDTVPLKGGSGPSATTSPTPSNTNSPQDDQKQGNAEPRSEESDVGGGDSSCLHTHMKALEVAYLRSFVLGVFQGLQKELAVHQNDIQAALDHCHEAVMEIEITNFLQAICGHLRDFRLRLDLEHLRQRQPNPASQSTPLAKFQVMKQESACEATDTAAANTSMSSSSSSSSTGSSRFPLSLLKRHHPCRDLQQLHTSIRERFTTILLGSFQTVPTLPEFYYFCPRSLHHSSEGTPVEDFVYVSSRELELWEKKSDVFTEGEEDLEDDNTVNEGEEEDEEEVDDDDPDKSIEFRSEIGSTVFQRLHSQLTALEGDEDKTSVITEQDEDLSTLPDNQDPVDSHIPPLFLHLTCTIRVGGHVHATISLKNLPTCLDEVAHSLSCSDVNLSSLRITLDVLCMTLPPAMATKTASDTQESALELSRSFRTISFCSTTSPQLKRGRSISESTCASLSDIDESFLEDEDQLAHLPNYQHQAILSTVEEIKWLLRDEIASAMLHTCHLKEANLEMVVAHVESSHHARNCISESIPLNFVCGMEQSKERFMQEFGRLSVVGHHLRQEGSYYYLVQDKTQMRRRHFSSVVPPLSFHNQSINFRPQPHADDSAQLRQMDSSCQEAKASLSSPDTIRCPSTRFQTGRVSFDTERRVSESLGEGEGGGIQRGEGPEKEKWTRRRERKERRDSERRGSINTSDSDSDIQQVRGPFSRESSHQSHDSRQRYSESPKKSSSLNAAKRASKGHSESKDKDSKSDKKEEKDKNSDDDNDNEGDTPGHEFAAPSGQPQETQKGSSEQSQNSEPQETSMKDQETGEETQQQVADSDSVCEEAAGGDSNEQKVSSAGAGEKGDMPAVAEDNEEKGDKSRGTEEKGDLEIISKGGEEKGDVQAANEDPHASPRSLDGRSVEVEDGEDIAASTDPRSKDPSHRLSLPLNELIRCGSESLPRPQPSAEVIRKSASTDSFVPSITEASVDILRTPPTATLTANTSGGLWAEFMKSRHNSSDVLKSRNSSGTSVDLLKSRHNSGTGGDLLKSRHNSGTGSVLGGPYSDVSSLLESGQTTEDGCEGDISDSDNDCSDWLQDFELVEPFLPEFWLIMRVSDDRVDTFFHCRTEAELGQWRSVQADMVRNVRALVKLVNQVLLLQDLHNTRMCNPLLEPETSEEIWLHEDTKGRSVYDSEPEYRAFLEASFKFKPGAFACRAVWETRFELHHKVCTGKVGSKGILALRTILNPFSVNNRKNMFVYEDKSGNGSHVFYLRLKEHQSSSVSPQVDGRREEAGLPHSASVSSLVKRGSREDDPQVVKTELRPRVSSFGEKDVIMEGVPSTPAQRRRSHYIVLTVHGIAEPGPAIKEELVRMLQNRLDEAVVEAICLMLWNNPQQKLTLEDVHFIQPPYQPPKTMIRFTINASALPHLQAVGYYLRQNMLSCGFIHPKYADSCPEHHFQDFSATDQDLSNEPNIFLFVRPRKSAAKGIACIVLSLVDGSGCPIQYMSCARPSQLGYQEIFSRQDFEAIIHTQEYQASPTKSPGPMAMLQFKVWESGRVDLAEVRRYLMDSIRHALWDVNMEYCLLTAPIMPSLSVPQHTTPASEPTTPKKEVRGPTLRSVSLLESGSSNSPQRAEDRTRSVSVSGVPPHVCLPRMASRLGSKRMVRAGEGKGDSQRERAPSPLTLVQARLRLMSSSVPDLKVRARRASLHYPWDGSPVLEVSSSQSAQGHSPLKVRHSVDLGVDRSKLLGDEGPSLPQEPWEYPSSLSSLLHPLYHTIMLEWLEFASELEERGEHTLRRELGEKSGEHAVKRHTITLSTKHAVPVFLTELQKWLSQNAADTSTKIFEEVQQEEGEKEQGGCLAYKLVESSKIPPVLKSDASGGYTHTNFIIISRNNQQWWATLFEENFNDYYINTVTASKSSQRYPPLVVSPRGRCLSGGDMAFSRADGSSVTSSTGPPPSSTSMPVTPFTTSAGVVASSSFSSSANPISPPVTVPSTPTSTTNAMGSFWSTDTPDVVFIPRQKLLLATLRGMELVIYTYNWTKEQCDNLHTTMTRLAHWTTARNRLLSTIVLQKMGLYHNQPFNRKAPIRKDEDNNPYMGNQSHVDTLIKLQAPARESPGTTDRAGRRPQGMVSLLSLTDIRESRPPRPPLGLHHPNLKDLELRHGTQMAEIRRLVVQKENQRKVLLKMVVETRGHSSPVFTDKILSLYKQNARIVHFCLTPLLFLPRWRWQVAATRDHSLVSPGSAEKTFGTKTPESRSRHDSGNSMKSGVSGIAPSGLRLSFSLKSSVVVSASPGQQRRRHVTGGGDEKWHDALCSSYLKEYIQYLQSLGFLTLNITQTPQQRGRLNRESESRGFRVKEVRFNEQVTKEPTYLLKNVLGGTILLEIAFSEPYFSVKIYVLESCRLEAKKLSSQMEGAAEVKPGGPLSSPLSPTTPLFPEGCPPDQIEDKFAINSFLDKVDDIKVLLHLHSFTYDFHLRALCAYVADRQLLFTRGYHLSSCLSDFIKYYNKGPNFARNLIYSGALTIEDTGTPGEQLYNYLLAREKQYKMKVLRMTPVILDPDAVMHNTEFILVHTKTCHVHYRDGNDQRVSDDYDVTLLVSHNTAANSLLHHLHLNFYVILTSTREMYPNRILEKKMGHFRTVSIAPSLGRRWTPSSTQTESCDHSGTDTPPITTTCEEASDPTIATQEGLPSSVKSFGGIRSESVNYLGYYTQYEETMQRTLELQAEEARTRIHHIFNQAKIHCRRDSLWQRLTASLREEDRQKLPREQVLGGLSFTELSELLNLVSVEPLGSVDSQLLPLLSKPLHWYQGLIRVLQSKYQERHRNLTSSDGNIQHVVVLSPGCPDAFMMLSINLHHQKAELCCVYKQLKGEGTSPVLDQRVQALIQDFVNACCFHLWSGLL